MAGALSLTRESARGDLLPVKWGGCMRELGIENVKKALECLDSARFEKLCYVFMDFITGERLHHRGENIRGDAVGHTVDSYSDDGRIVGEYSIDRKYFSDLKKPEQDIIHAHEKFPNLQQLYLCVGIEATPGQGTDTANLCEKYQEKFKIEIKWFDSRSIAEIIVDDISDKNKIRNRIADIASGLAEAIGKNSIGTNIPELPENYSFPQETAKRLLNNLEKNHFLYLHGISGIGKTMLSVYLQNEMQKTVQVDNVEFINVSQISAMEELRQFKEPMFGYGVDLLHTIQSGKSVFILDDLSKDLNRIVPEILQSLGNDSYVMITSQLACQAAQSNGLAFEMENLDSETADEVFSYELKNPGTKEQRALLYRKTAGYPILLNAVRSLMQYEGLKWEELEDELAHVPDYEVGEGINLTKRLLRRHQEVLSREFFAIHWLETNYISRTLLRKLISREGIRKLKSRSFLQELPEVIKVHDIVYECINSLDFESERNRKASADYQERLLEALEERIEKKDAEYYQMLHLHENKIISIAQESSAFGKETYFYLQAFPNDEKGVLEKYEEAYINKMIQETTDAYVYKSIMEWYELNLRKMRKRHEKDYASQVQVYINSLESMLNRLDKSAGLYADLLHHQGKLYHNLKQAEDAMRCFKEVLEFDPAAYETKLQIARIRNKQEQKDKGIAVSIYREILDSYIQGEEISMSVVLAAYEDIVHYLNEEITNYYFIEHFQEFRNAIISLSGTTYDQPYIVLAKVSKIYTYNYPDYLKELLDRLHLPSLEKIHKRNYFNIAKMYMEFGKALRNLKREDEKAKKYFEIAEYYFGNMDSGMHLKSFQTVRIADNFLLLRKYDDALQFLNQHVFEEDAFWWYRKSCALLWLDYYKDALHCCNMALLRMEGKPEGKKYLSTFYRKKAQIIFYYQKDEHQIIDLLNQAIENCNEKKYRNQLEGELSTYRNKGKLEKE